MNKLFFFSLLMITLDRNGSCKKHYQTSISSPEIIFTQVCIPPSIHPQPEFETSMIACYDISLKNPPTDDSVRIRAISVSLQVLNPMPEMQDLSVVEIAIDGVTSTIKQPYQGEPLIFPFKDDEIVLKKGTIKHIQVMVAPITLISPNKVPGTIVPFTSGTIYCWGGVPKSASVLINKNVCIPVSFKMPKSTGVKIL